MEAWLTFACEIPVRGSKCMELADPENGHVEVVIIIKTSSADQPLQDDVPDHSLQFMTDTCAVQYKVSRYHWLKSKNCQA